jgi:hypothetical protein
MASHSKRTVWMNFTGGDSKHLDCSFLYPSEREKMKQHITMWAESEENYYNELTQLMPFLLADDQLILVVTDYQDGEVSPKHPILVRLESQIENLSDFIVYPNLNEENVEAMLKGAVNLQKHIETVQAFHVPFVVAINAFSGDTAEETKALLTWCREHDYPAELSEGWAKGGEGTEALAG